MTDYFKSHFGKSIDKMSKPETAYLQLAATQEFERLSKKYKGQESVLIALGHLLSQTRGGTSHDE